MKITDNIEMLEVEADLANGSGMVHPVVIWDEKDVVLFDAGLPDMVPQIQTASIQAGLPFERLNKILVTHSDMDHIGSLAQIIQESKESITVYAHREEKPYIECALPPVRLAQMVEAASQMQGAMREQLSEMVEKLKKNYQLFQANVDHTPEDGEVLPFCGGITCIHTPGHTPGHMCYYLKDHGLLIAGDIFAVVNGDLKTCPERLILNQNDMAASLEKLCGYSMDTVICYHGGLFTGDAAGRIAGLAGRPFFD